MNLTYTLHREGLDGSADTAHEVELTVEPIRRDPSVGDMWAGVVLTAVQHKDDDTGRWIDFPVTEAEWWRIEDAVQ